MSFELGYQRPCSNRHALGRCEEASRSNVPEKCGGHTNRGPRMPRSAAIRSAKPGPTVRGEHVLLLRARGRRGRESTRGADLEMRSSQAPPLDQSTPSASAQPPTAQTGRVVGTRMNAGRTTNQQGSIDPPPRIDLGKLREGPAMQKPRPRLGRQGGPFARRAVPSIERPVDGSYDKLQRRSRRAKPLRWLTAGGLRSINCTHLG